MKRKIVHRKTILFVMLSLTLMLFYVFVCINSKTTLNSEPDNDLNQPSVVFRNPIKEGSNVNNHHQKYDWLPFAGFPITATWKEESILENDNTVHDCVSGYPVRTKTTTIKTNFKQKIISLTINVTETSMERKQSFEEIYKKQTWGRYQEKVESKYTSVKGSGPGSTLRATQRVMRVLHNVIDNVKQKLGKAKISILDIPCGDFTWMSEFLRQRRDVMYTGMDIVSSLIKSHNSTFKNNKQFSFVLQDIVDKPLDGNYDIIFCRMMLQHLTMSDVMNVLYNFSRSRSHYLLVTTHPSVPKALPIALVGPRFRFLNLEIPPVQLEPPICMSPDAPLDTPITDHYVGLWKLPLKQLINCKTQRVQMAGGENFYACV